MSQDHSLTKTEILPPIAELIQTDYLIQIPRSELEMIKQLLGDALFPRVKFTGNMKEMEREATAIMNSNIKSALSLIGKFDPL